MWNNSQEIFLGCNYYLVERRFRASRCAKDNGDEGKNRFA
jgi:hypothetical protein